MKLYEASAKKVFQEFGLSIPKGRLVTDPLDTQKVVEEVGVPCVMKAQVLAGGRGKGGAIRFAGSVEEARETVQSMLSSRFKGFPIRRVLIEEKLDIDKEFFMGIVTDRDLESPLIIVSPVGGVEIEEIAKRTPAKVARIPVNPVFGLADYEARLAFFRAGLPSKVFPSFVDTLKRLYRVYWACEAELTEANPLVLTTDGRLICADARLNIDDSALFRHPKLKEAKIIDPEDPEALSKGRFNYVPLEGNIGIISSGAGSCMATMDLVHEKGGKPACFLDGHLTMKPGTAQAAIGLLASRPEVNVILISTYTGGRCEKVAERIIDAMKNLSQLRIPVVVRLQGRNEDEAQEILKSYDSPLLKIAKSPLEAAEMAVRLGEKHEYPRK